MNRVMTWLYPLALLVCLNLIHAAEHTDETPNFSFHLFGEPYSLDPATSSLTAGSYLFHTLYAGLYRYSAQGLEPEGARVCRAQGLSLVCELDSRVKWSNGDPVTADDYVKAIRRVANPDTKSTAAELLLNLKNAKKILKEEARIEDLGVRSQGPLRLIFDFENPDPEFIYKLTHPALIPLHSLPIATRERAAELITNGPYVIESWKKGQKLHLKPNPFYPRPESLGPAPHIEILLIDDDSTALRLYEAGKLTFLRRVSINDAKPLEKRKDFYKLPVARFDYIGFGPELKNLKSLRKALALSLNYQEFKGLLQTDGTPGCPAIQPSYFANYPCHRQDLKGAKKALAEVPEDVRKRPLKIYFSRMGGDGVQTSVEWLQNQWSRHLGLNVELQSQEQAVVTQTIRSGQAPIFRRGVNLDRPSCLSAIELFESENPENFIRFSDQRYDAIVRGWDRLKSPAQRKIKCTQAVQRLLDEYALIPLGVITFFYMAKPEFKGWSLNELNQLDVRQLVYKKSP